LRAAEGARAAGAGGQKDAGVLLARECEKAESRRKRLGGGGLRGGPDERVELSGSSLMAMGWEV